jgi:oligopeptide/dipeptide ABC transporter ATP-binding protein
MDETIERSLDGTCRDQKGIVGLSVSGSSAASCGEPGDPILRIENVSVEFKARGGRVRVVDGVDLVLERGRTLAVVGESGSGKTVTALSILQLLTSTASTSGAVYLEKEDLLALDRRAINKVRGKQVAMIFQEPRRSLDPAFPVGKQIAEVARRHLGLSRSASMGRAVDLLARVGISSPRQRAKDYPHEFSGGMCQRVMIAMALVATPKILIADEPTTALDVTMQALVLDLLRELQEEFGLTVLFITHDLAVAAEVSDRVAVMYAGQVVEVAPSAEIFNHPSHPYTEGLLASLPQNHARDERLGSIRGAVPPPHALPGGCRFHPRCLYADPRCTAGVVELAALPAGDQHARCVRADELELRGVR